MVDYKTAYSNELSRPLRNGVIKSLLDLQSLINDLIKYCNEFGIIDPMTGNTETITVDPPRSLTADSEDYQPQLNAQWELIEGTLNKLSNFLKEMED